MREQTESIPKPGEIVATGKIEEVLDYHQSHGWQIVPGSGRWEPDPFRPGRERYVVDVVQVDKKGEKRMIANSNIEWTGPTWNPWQGCKKKSAGCKFCYMYRDKKRYGQDPTTVVRSAPATFNKPLKLQKEVEQGLRPNLQDRLVFTCSWSDWFNKEADEWRPEAWEIISQCPDLIFQILTKLPQRILDHLPHFWDEIKSRCWMGTSIENQEVDWRIDELLKIDAAVRFLSLEPLLGPVDLNDSLLCQFVKGPMVEPKKGTINGKSFATVRLRRGIDWVIIGGESGPGARPFDLAWAEALIGQCQANGIPVFMKQLGSNPIDGPGTYKTGYSIKDKKGGDMAEWPVALRIREFPHESAESRRKLKPCQAGHQLCEYGHASLTGHNWHCPECDVHLTSLYLCGECGCRYTPPNNN